jgi:hypothetical protein
MNELGNVLIFSCLKNANWKEEYLNCVGTFRTSNLLLDSILQRRMSPTERCELLSLQVRNTHRHFEVYTRLSLDLNITENKLLKTRSKSTLCIIHS